MNNKPRNTGFDFMFEPTQPQGVPITPPYTDKECFSIIEKFKQADELQVKIFDTIIKADQNYPFEAHIIAQPHSSITAWVQGVAVFDGEICLVVTYTKDVSGQLMFIKEKNVVYLAARGPESVVITNEFSSTIP
jgi:hypothetical protein